MSTSDALVRSDALLEAIYTSAVEPSAWLSLHRQLLKNFRHREQPSVKQAKFVDLVLAHIQRALKIAETRERLQWERRQIADFIDGVAPAICVVRADRTLVGLNPAANRLLGAAVGVPLAAETLGADAAHALDCALETARLHGHGVAACTRGPNQQLLLHVGRLPSAEETLFSILIFQPGEALDRALARHAELFRLTSKERSVVEQVVRCDKLDEVAAAECIGYHTARQHLRSVYEKTGTSSQSELVAGILRQSLVQEAARTENAALLPLVRGLAHSRFVRVRSRGQIRGLCYAEYGDPEGTPVVFFHSIAGSRLELFSHDALLRAHNIRLIAADRPGYGHSDFYEYATYTEHARDLIQLLDTLRLERVGLLAYSAGAPQALACAELLGDRASLLQCTSSAAPFEHVASSRAQPLSLKVQARMFRIAPALVRPAMELMLRGQTVESLFRAMVRDQSYLAAHPRDAQFISQPEQMEHFVACTIEALRQGAHAWAKEAAMLHHDWGISYRHIRCPVRFWHGDSDDLVPGDIIQSFARELPHVRVTRLEGETHLLVFRHLARIVRSFAPAGGGRSSARSETRAAR